MRELKFRAWNDTLSQMEYCTDDEYWMFFNDDKSIGWGLYHRRQDYRILSGEYAPPLMRFADLTDKNGKDIYFDDIVQDEKGNKYHVTYHELAPSMIFKGINCETHHTIIYSSMHEYEVIGNIHENPELIK